MLNFFSYFSIQTAVLIQQQDFYCSQSSYLLFKLVHRWDEQEDHHFDSQPWQLYGSPASVFVSQQETVTI